MGLEQLCGFNQVNYDDTIISVSKEREFRLGSVSVTACPALDKYCKLILFDLLVILYHNHIKAAALFAGVIELQFQNNLQTDPMLTIVKMTSQDGLV